MNYRRDLDVPMPAQPGHRVIVGQTNPYGDAKWMDDEGAAAIGLDRPGGVVIGQRDSGDRLYSWGEHLLIFAPTRAGKGIGFVQPNLIDYPGSMVVLDPKGENAIVSAEYRRRQGHKVMILDPFGKTRLASDNYNPLGALSFADDYDLGPAIETLVDALVIEPPDNKDPYWTDGAKKFCSFLMWWMVAHEPRERRNLITMFDLAHCGHEKLSKMATFMRQGRAADANTARMCKAMGNWYLDRNEKELSSFDSVVSNNFGWIGDFVWSKALGGQASPPLPLKSKTQPMTVYLVLPFNRMRRYQRWLRLMVADCLSVLYDTEGAPKTPVLFMLDEAYKGLGKMESLFEAMAAVASAGGRLAFVYQDVLQIEKLYGRAWESFAAQSSATLFFAVNDMTAAEYISRRCGDKTTRLPGNPAGVGERLIRPEAVLNMPKDEVLGLFRSARPGRFKRLDVLTDPRYKSKLAYNSTYDEPEEREYTARDAYVPVDLDAVDLAGAGRDDDDDIDTEELIFLAKLAKKYNRHVFVNESGHYGYKDERGMFVRVDK